MSAQVAAATSDRGFFACLWRVVPALSYRKLEAWSLAKTGVALERTPGDTMTRVLADLGVRDGGRPVAAAAAAAATKSAAAAVESLEVLKVQREARANADLLAATLKDAGSARARDLMLRAASEEPLPPVFDVVGGPSLGRIGSDSAVSGTECALALEIWTRRSLASIRSR